MELDKNLRGSLTGLLGAALRKDIPDVKDCAAFVAKRLQDQGEKDCAQDLRNLLGGEDFIDGAWTPQHWVDETHHREREDPLLRIFRSYEGAQPLGSAAPPSILTAENRTIVKEILEVARLRLQRQEPLPTCVLVYGTAIQEPVDLARYIARQLELEFVGIEPTKVCERRVGRWSGQLHRLCDVATKRPRVWALLKLEKFCDSALVQDSWRIEELKCVRDRFLKELSLLETPAVVVACTNMEMELAPEDWERFSYRIELNAAEPDPWLLLGRGLAAYGFDGFEKAFESLPPEAPKKPLRPPDLQD